MLTCSNVKRDYEEGICFMMDDEEDYLMPEEGEDEAGSLLLEADGNSAKKKSYFVLSTNDIKQRQQQVIEDVTSVLWLSQGEASMLLRYYGWDPSRAKEEWVLDEERVRGLAGLVTPQIPTTGKDGVNLCCEICFEEYPEKDTKLALCCAHPYCYGCWERFIQTAIADGPGCLTLKCPHPKCKAAVLDDMAMSLVPEKDAAAYERYMLRSYVERAKGIKWCPAPDCQFAVELLDRESYVVTCKCEHSFCWDCIQEPHRPIDCETVEKWMQKNNSEKENTTWLVAYSKPCPKCKRPIEKSVGCMHMTCSHPCGFQFCWTCLAPWRTHGTCNKFTEDVVVDLKRKREALNDIKRYHHYYQRWDANAKSCLKARRDLKEMKESKLEHLSKEHAKTIIELHFLIEAWEQIVRCREVLTWTYAYGYYLDEAKQEFFEYLQGDAERELETLHHCAEKEMPDAFKDNSEPGTSETKTKLITLTRVTNHHFENLVRALERGLEDVKAGPSTSKAAFKGVKQNAAGHQFEDYEVLERSGNYEKYALQLATEAHRDLFGHDKSSSANQAYALRLPNVINRGHRVPELPPPSNINQVEEEAPSEEEETEWFCPHCTVRNDDMLAQDCSMCALPRFPLDRD